MIEVLLLTHAAARRCCGPRWQFGRVRVAEQQDFRAPRNRLAELVQIQRPAAVFPRQRDRLLGSTRHAGRRQEWRIRRDQRENLVCRLRQRQARHVDARHQARRAGRTPARRQPTVAVVGAGISGISCARTLADHGLPVTVFEKSRGVGGRMATRRSDNGAAFDHGAQYFTVRDERFQNCVALAEGLLALDES